VGVKEHFVALAGIGHQPEGAAGTQLQMRNLKFVEDATHHQAFIAPVELERLAQLECQWHKCLGSLALMIAPGADEIGDTAVATRITIGLDLNKQRLGRAPVLLGTVRVGFEGQLQRLGKRRELAWHLRAPVRRLGHLPRIAHPLAYRVARKPRGLGYLVQRKLIA